MIDEDVYDRRAARFIPLNPVWFEKSGMYYDRSGREITLADWLVRQEDRGYVRIKETSIGRFWVSTIWLGLDHLRHRNKPITFETMIFARAKRKRGIRISTSFQMTYQTEEFATIGHYQACRMVHSGWRG